MSVLHLCVPIFRHSLNKTANFRKNVVENNPLFDGCTIIARGHFTVCSAHFASPLWGSRNTMQLVKRQLVLSMKPSNRRVNAVVVNTVRIV